MKHLITILFFASLAFGQQINHSYGLTTSGVAYTSSGGSVDSSTAVNVIFDLQDYYFTEIDQDSSGDKLYIGTLWFSLDAASASDSTNLNINVYPGGFIYDDGDGTRYESTEYSFSSTAVTLRDSSTSRTLGDIAWSPVNVYLSATSKILPPELIKIQFAVFDPAGTGGTELASGSIYWDFVYPAVYQGEQEQRTTKRQDANNRKDRRTLK